jgi:hypothetical protein
MFVMLTGQCERRSLWCSIAVEVSKLPFGHAFTNLD